MKILILGVTGMLGHRLFLELSKTFDVFGTTRNASIPSFVNDESKIIKNVDAFNTESIQKAIIDLQPDLIINCIGIIKQVKSSQDHLTSIKINALLPHEILSSVEKINSRLIHFSTDCVFDGKEGNYNEESEANATDLYGRTKLLGEVTTSPNAITIRTSIIGREIKPTGSLIEWFLSQENEVNGFKNAIFSGFPTKTFASIIKDYIISNKELNGLFQISSNPINKFDLLNLTKDIFNKKIKINEETHFNIDRSLNSNKFKEATGYEPPKWSILIKDLLTDDIPYKEY